MIFQPGFAPCTWCAPPESEEDGAKQEEGKDFPLLGVQLGPFALKHMASIYRGDREQCTIDVLSVAPGIFFF